MLKEIKRTNSTLKIDNNIKLNDDTVVKNMRWSGLKKIAMDAEFKSSK